MNSTFDLLLSSPVRSHSQGLARQPVLLCFSHLRWDFVYQRPQHLLNEAAANYRVYFIEEPVTNSGAAHFKMRIDASGVTVLTPVIDEHSDPVREQEALMEGLQRSFGEVPCIHWYYTPMALQFTRTLDCDLCVYDCMDELSAFRFAPPDLVALEGELLRSADLVFTGGRSLYKAKRQRHKDVHCFPSSVDATHFARARTRCDDPKDQADLAVPRIGYAGVIDERIDLDLIAKAAGALPDVQFVMLGPIAKIDPNNLPRAANLHWLGRKDYGSLPCYMANWQAAWMPFALNDATRFISPTKTPEYLAAGLRVTATAVADVVDTYGRQGLVTIADADSIAEDLRESLAPPPPGWKAAVDWELSRMSWAGTWRAMNMLISARLRVLEEA